MSTVESQRGVALIMAIIVVAIGTMIAVNLIWRGTLDLRRTESALAADQGLMYVQGAEAWAADILRQDLVDSPNSDHLGEQWAIELPPLPVDGGTITGRLEDLQGRFNLNNLIDASGKENKLAVEQFERLLVSVEADPALAGAVVDWLDPDTNQRFPTGGEDDAYSDADPPYRTANSMVTSTSMVLVLSPMIDIATATSLVEQRGEAEFVDIDATFAGLVSPDMLQQIDGVSEHFLLTATVTLGKNQLTMRSVLQRDRSGITRAVFRSLGVD